MTHSATRSAAWLRDACVCAECRDPVSGQHLLDIGDLHGWRVVDETSAGAVLEHEGGTRHTCVLGPLTPTDIQRRVAPDPRLRLVAYRSENWVERVATDVVATGAALVTGVPIDRGNVLTVAAELGYVRETNYGALFDVEAVPDPNNLAYSTLGLPLHTDNPYRDPAPTVQLLHCIKPSTSGGETIIADGFGAADQLRSAKPVAFEVLATTPVRFRFADATTELSTVRSIIDLQADGGVQAVHLNHRSMLPPTTDIDTEAFYGAYRSFALICQDDAFCASFTLGAGELLVFDNRRMLHARSGFPVGDGRHLQGCYIDIDALRSLAARAPTTR